MLTYGHVNGRAMIGGPIACASGMHADEFANMITSKQSFDIEYFNQSVLDEIENWPVGVLADYARKVELLTKLGPALGMPHSKAMGGGLFELRPRGREGICRACYCFAAGRRIVVLIAFAKKTTATPRRRVSLARMRMKEVQRG
jgi:phage-related protein